MDQTILVGDRSDGSRADGYGKFEAISKVQARRTINLPLAPYAGAWLKNY